MRRALPVAPLVILALLGAAPRTARAELVHGVVVVNTSSEPVQGVPVVVQSATRPSLFRSVVSAADGTFVIPDMPPGMYTVRPSIGATTFTGYSSFLVPPGGLEGRFEGPIALPTGMSTGVELRLSTPDSGGGGTPPVPFEGRLDAIVRRAVGRTDIADGDLFSFDVGWPSEPVAGRSVRVTPVTPSGTPFDLVTEPSGFATAMGVATVAVDAPPTLFEFDVALLGPGGVPGTPTRLGDLTPAWYAQARFVLPPRLATITGRVFVEPGVADDDFDPQDQPLPGTTVRLYAGGDVPPVGPPLRSTVTGVDGTYAFPDVVDGLYLFEVDTPAGPERRLRDVSLYLDERAGRAPVVDFALTPLTCPRRPCDGGALHEVVLEGEAFVGDVPSLDVTATLSDGCPTGSVLDEARGVVAGTLGGPFSGFNGVVTVESVSVVLGVARARVRLSADAPTFPGGFFGGTERRLTLSVGRGRVAGCAVLDCDGLAAGSLAVARDASRWTASRWTVVSTWSYDSWRRCATLGPCRAQSETPGGGLNSIVVELPLTGPLPRRSPRTLEVVAWRGSRRFDAASATLSGMPWGGSATGAGGVLTLLGVRLEGGRPVVTLRLTAPDRLDGNPGALPRDRVRLVARIGSAWATWSLDLAAPPAPGRVRSAAGAWLATVVSWRNPEDADCP